MKVNAGKTRSRQRDVSWVNIYSSLSVAFTSVLPIYNEENVLGGRVEGAGNVQKGTAGTGGAINVHDTSVFP